MGYISEDYCSEELSGMLMENGYIGVTNTYLDKGDFNVQQITLQSAMKWLREEKGIAVIPILSSILDYEKFLWDIKIIVAKTGDTYSQGWVYEKQENACETAIEYCLKNLI